MEPPLQSIPFRSVGRLACCAVSIASLGGATLLAQAKPEPTPPAPKEAELVAAVSTANTRTALMELAQRDPMAIARIGRERYTKHIRDYACLFQKRERINGKLGKVEEIEVRFREKPHSVYMIWKKNEDQVKRALFIDDPKMVDEKGRKLALVEPAGAIIRLLVSEVKLPINGERAKSASRRTMDEFGFGSTFELLDRYNSIAEERDALDFKFVGEDTVDGRPTFVFERHLPYAGGDGPYPDAKMVMHFDQEWLLPTAVYSYGDHEGKELLGSYVYTNLRLNPGFTESDFKF